MENEGGFDKGGSRGNGKSSDSSYILNVKPTGFPDSLEGTKEKKLSTTPRFFPEQLDKWSFYTYWERLWCGWSRSDGKENG